ncbi:MAG: glycosyltransferase [Verrucomicrobia bacterium]|nr:glycosyltransferase [Verrucomicrobiota bacterium]
MSTRLKIVFLTPGTGGWYCGACMRDNALAKSLQAAGHEVSLLPMYLPLQLDEEVLERTAAAPVFFGGINVFLQQKFAVFRHTPQWLYKLLNHPRLLRRVARHSHMTSAREHGAMTLAMLRLDDHRFGKELDQLCAWLQQDSPDILCLSTALQAGMIRELKRRLGVKVLCCFQGEDTFLDGLPQPYRDACWRDLALRVRDADTLIAPSTFYANLMRQRLGPAALTIEVMPNGINLAGYAPLPVKPGPPVLGFLARMTREKGLEIMVEAFVHLRTVLGHPTARLHLAGAATADNQPLIDSLQQRLTAAGLSDQVRWQPNLSREDKAAMLRSLTLFSVPATYPEAFGLYVLEAMASGVPVVQPAAASFPEIVATAGVGVLVPIAVPNDWQAARSAGVPPAPARLARPDGITGGKPGMAEGASCQSAQESTGRMPVGHARQEAYPPATGTVLGVAPASLEPGALAQAWHDLLQQPEKLREMAANSRRAAEEFYDVGVMRDRFLALARHTLGTAEDNRSASG